MPTPVIDEIQFLQLVRQHHARMVGVASAFVANRSTAEEVVQETWLVAIEKLHALENPQSLTAWLYTILTNKARRRGQRDKRIQNFSDLGTEEQGDPVDAANFTGAGLWQQRVLPWDELDPERVISGWQLWQHMQQAIEDLPELQRLVILLSSVEGLESGDVCRALQITDNNRRVVLHRTREKLRRGMQDLLLSRPDDNGSITPC
jgi:RNA polymerase sigma-70 factor (ECF subfamily)